MFVAGLQGEDKFNHLLPTNDQWFGMGLSFDRSEKRYEAVPNIPHFRLLAGWIWDMYDFAHDMANIPMLENIATTDNPIQVAIHSLLHLADRRPLIADVGRVKQVQTNTFR